ncbi:MAG: hypothetical protein LBO69_01425 [Ignavibacteria bacterium]|jgi:hypothetical protein|nr:hypothetical protein [Ignavibacteria bacterium]
MGLLDSVKDTFTSGSFEIEDTMTISEIQKRFKKAFGCSLRIYKGSALADGRMTIKTLDERQTRNVKQNAGKLKIKASDKVGEAEK